MHFSHPPCCSQGWPALAAAEWIHSFLPSPRSRCSWKSAPRMSRVLLPQLRLLALEGFAVASNKRTRTSLWAEQGGQQLPPAHRGDPAARAGLGRAGLDPRAMQRSCVVCESLLRDKALWERCPACPACLAAFIFAALWRELACKQSADAWAFFTFRFAEELV